MVFLQKHIIIIVKKITDIVKSAILTSNYLQKIRNY